MAKPRPSRKTPRTTPSKAKLQAVTPPAAQPVDCESCKVAPVCGLYADFKVNAERILGGAKQALPGWAGEITLKIIACPLYTTRE